MDGLVILIISGLSFWGGYKLNDKPADVVTIEHGCSAPLTILNPTRYPPELPKPMTCLDIYETIPMYKDAILSCNADKEAYKKEAERLNREIQKDKSAP